MSNPIIADVCLSLYILRFSFMRFLTVQQNFKDVPLHVCTQMKKQWKTISVWYCKKDGLGIWGTRITELLFAAWRGAAGRKAEPLTFIPQPLEEPTAPAQVWFHCIENCKLYTWAQTKPNQPSETKGPTSESELLKDQINRIYLYVLLLNRQFYPSFLWNCIKCS